MLTTPMDVLVQFPIRKSTKQKQAFRDAVQGYCESLDYSVATEKGSMGARNLVIGDPKHAKFLVTAHYDTCAHMPFPNFITPCNLVVYLLYQLLIVALLFAIAFAVGSLVSLVTEDFAVCFWCAYLTYFAALFLMMCGPANKNNANDNTSGVVTLLEIIRTLPKSYRDRVCFVLFDLEEAGLIGSASYRKAHKNATERQIVLNLDCIGDGDEILMFPTGKLRKNTAKLALLEKIQCSCGSKRLSLHQKGFAFCPSDQSNFPYGVGIMAFHQGKGIGLYCSRIHTNRDTILEQTNVNILRAALTTLICQ